MISNSIYTHTHTKLQCAHILANNTSRHPKYPKSICVCICGKYGIMHSRSYIHFWYYPFVCGMTCACTRLCICCNSSMSNDITIIMMVSIDITHRTYIWFVRGGTSPLDRQKQLYDSNNNILYNLWCILYCISNCLPRQMHLHFVQMHHHHSSYEVRILLLSLNMEHAYHFLRRCY